MFAMVWLSSCSPTTKLETNQQKLYSLVSKYQLAQKLAVAYKEQCDEGLIEQVSCTKALEEIRRVDKQANLIIQAIDPNQINDAYKTSISGALLALTGELKTIVNRRLIK